MGRWLSWERLRRLSRSFLIGDETVLPGLSPSSATLHCFAVSNRLNHIEFPHSNMFGALGQPLVLHDLAGNHSVLIIRVNGAQTMVAVRDDHCAISRISDEEQRG